jgi:hypothetical protein
MTDDELLDALDRRLAGVESRLPPRPVIGPSVTSADSDRRWRPGATLRSLSALSVVGVVAVLVTVVAFGLAGRPTNRAPVAAAPPSGSAVVVGTPAPSSVPSVPPSESPPELLVVEASGDGMIAFMDAMGWGRCGAMLNPFPGRFEDGAELDLVIDRSDGGDGFVETGPDRLVWVGLDAESAARAFGASLLIIDPDGTPSYVAVDDVGRVLRRVDTPKGRTGWYLSSEAISGGPCDPEDESPAPASSPAIEVVRDTRYGGDHVLASWLGWDGPCFTAAMRLMVEPDFAEADAAIDRAGLEEGFVEMARGDRLWVGPTPESAARGYGSPVVAIGRNDDTWIAIDDIGWQLRSFETPKGRSLWVRGNNVRETACTGNE